MHLLLPYVTAHTALNYHKNDGRIHIEQGLHQTQTLSAQSGSRHALFESRFCECSETCVGSAGSKSTVTVELIRPPPLENNMDSIDCNKTPTLHLSSARINSCVKSQIMGCNLMKTSLNGAHSNFNSITNPSRRVCPRSQPGPQTAGVPVFGTDIAHLEEVLHDAWQCEAHSFIFYFEAFTMAHPMHKSASV